jgi:hypothetical protein
MCDYSKGPLGIDTSRAMFFVKNSIILSLFTDWTMLYLKNERDILQGVSKLDNLLKVSYFQKYKKNKEFNIVKKHLKLSTSI